MLYIAILHGQLFKTEYLFYIPIILNFFQIRLCKIIFSKQGAMNQLWMAAKSGGYHYDYNEEAEQWICDNGDNEELYNMLSRLSSEQAGEDVLLAAP